MAWEKFTLSGRSIKPQVTIRTGGQIGLNNPVVTKYELNKFKYVVFFIDREEKKIGIKPTNDENEEGLCRLRISEYGASISARSFVEQYKLEEIKKRQLDCDWDKKDGMIVAKYTE